MGIERGSILKLTSQMIKKTQKGKTLDMIADEVECELEEIIIHVQNAENFSGQQHAKNRPYKY